MRQIWLLLAGLVGSAVIATAGEGLAGPLVLERRLLSPPTRLQVDDAYARRPLAGIQTSDLSPDLSPGASAGGYLVSLTGRTLHGQLDAMRAVLLRGRTVLRIPAVAGGESRVLVFYSGSNQTARPRPKLRPWPFLDVVLIDLGGRRLGGERIWFNPRRVEQWTEHRIDLGAYAGKVLTVELSLGGPFQTEDDHCFVSDVGLYRRDAVGGRRPNVVIFWLDKVRADLLAASGGPPELTPVMNELAATHAYFSHAYTSSNHTAAVMAQTMLSSIAAEALWGRRELTLPTLPGELKRAGWYTVSMGTNVHMTPLPGLGEQQLDVGFDRAIAQLDGPDRRHNEMIYETQLASWLRHERREPFFLNVLMPGGHEPFPSLDAGGPPSHWDRLVDLAGGDHQEARYLWKVQQADQVLGRALRLLRKVGALDDAVVVIVADHGTTLGSDHRTIQWGHNQVIRTSHPTGFYEAQVRIPLIVAHPSLGHGRRDEPVSLLDLMPTVLDLVGLDVPPQVDGRSLREAGVQTARSIPFACREEGMYGLVERPYKYVHYQQPVERWPIAPDWAPEDRYYWLESHERARFDQQLAAYRGQGIPIGQPYVVAGELFQLDEDPRELDNLVQREPERAARMRDVILGRVAIAGTGARSLDPSRLVVAVVSPEKATFEVRIEANEPIKPESRWGECDPWALAQDDPLTVRFTCGSRAGGGLRLLRRLGTTLSVRARKDGVDVESSRLFIGPHGMPPRSAGGDVIVLAPDAMPLVSRLAPTIVAGRDDGLFVFRLELAAGLAVQQSAGVAAAFGAWGYAH